MANNTNDSVHYFVRGLFRGMGETESIAELREELESHLNDRITDSVASGLSHDESFSRAIASLGNLDELVETLTGQKKKVYVKKLDWLMMAGGIMYGTLYMIAVGIWFSVHSFGFSAIYIAAVGWLGYAVPAIIKYFEYRTNPKATALIPLDNTREIRASVIGWLCISVACCLLNALFIGTDLFLNGLWAWMPIVGTATWPLMTAGYYWMVKNLKSPEIEETGI